MWPTGVLLAVNLYRNYLQIPNLDVSIIIVNSCRMSDLSLSLTDKIRESRSFSVAGFVWTAFCKVGLEVRFLGSR